jgi:hypothetical protein
MRFAPLNFHSPSILKSENMRVAYNLEGFKMLFQKGDYSQLWLEDGKKIQNINNWG